MLSRSLCMTSSIGTTTGLHTLHSGLPAYRMTAHRLMHNAVKPTTTIHLVAQPPACLLSFCMYSNVFFARCHGVFPAPPFVRSPSWPVHDVRTQPLLHRSRIQLCVIDVVCFDVDCTITVNDSLDLLAEFMGKKEAVEAITNQVRAYVQASCMVHRQCFRQRACLHGMAWHNIVICMDAIEGVNHKQNW